MIRSFVKDMFIYALPMFLARAVGLVLLPVYTRELGPADFGFIEFVAASSAILLLALPLEINQALGRLIPESKGLLKTQTIISTSLWFTVSVFFLFSAVVYIFRYKLLAIANLPSEYEEYILIICIHLLVLAIVNLLQVQFRFTNQAISSVIINTSIVIVNLLLVMYFVMASKLDIHHYFLSQVISGGAGALIGLILLAFKFKSIAFLRYLDRPTLKELLTYSLPIVLSSIGVSLSAGFDRVLVGSYIGLADLGYYGAAIRLSAIVGLGFYVIGSAMTPIVYREYKEKESETKLLIVSIMNATWYGCVAILLLIVFCAEYIVVLFLGDGFAQSSKYIFYLMLSAMVANSYIFFLGMDIKKNTKTLSVINLFSGIFGVLGSAIFIPFFGVWGAIYSTLASNFIRLSGYVYFSQRLYHIKVRLYLLLLMITFIILMNIVLNVKVFDY
jgi:O-antigen/teichoic acid export membrane protein